MATTPRGREKNTTGEGKEIKKKGEGLGTGPVGSSSGHAGRPGGKSSEDERGSLASSLLNMVSTNTSFSSSSHSSSSSGSGSLFGGKGLIVIALIAVLVFGGGGSLLGMFGSSDSTTAAVTVSPTNNSSSIANLLTSYSSLGLSSLFGGTSSGSSTVSSVLSGSSVSSGWTTSSNTGKLNTSTVSGTRNRYTTIKGNGKDVVTIMVYMCGTDLESSNGMGTADLSEMLNATVGTNINLLIYTGGCKQWRVNGISNKTNQIFRIADGKLTYVEQDMGNVSMTKPSTLSSFIKYCAKNYPADRNMLIFWDHGGGSLTGYGYDEKFSSSGSMSLSGIKQALTDGGVKFDFVGFDACLMATAETALMLTDYADYLIASEETEPGIGWYYTNWLTKLSANTSLSTLELGKQIVDDFVDTCARSCSGQKATLSVIDLAELEKTLPADLKAFSTATSTQISEDYMTVSNARSGAREFSSSSKIDQVDLVDLATKLGTDEAKELVSTILSAVKYNRTSTNMTNAYGLSIYFPYQRVSYVNSAVQTYSDIGMDSEYSRCIQAFASVEAGGQAVSGGGSSALSALLSNYTGGGTSVPVSSSGSSDMISSILSGLFSGSSTYNVSGLSSLTSSFLGKSISADAVADILSKEGSRFDPEQLVWKLYGTEADYQYGIYLPDEQWELIQNLELNIFYDDGEGGYIDLGLDNVFTINDYGVLVQDYDNSWLAIDNQPVAYYHVDTVDDGENYTITGRVPVLLGEDEVRADLILIFDNENPYGYIAGATYQYANGETETVAKSVTELEPGTLIQYICDYYSKDGKYLDSYVLDTGDVTVYYSKDMVISNVTLPASKLNATYLFTDIYNQQYWSPILPQK